ncbi:MAG: nucleotide sugar dehydrogenase [Planctomycetota bacterium]
MKEQTLTVVGLGKLGVPLCAVLASGGHRIIGVDRNVERVAEIVEGRCSIREPDLNRLLSDAGERIEVTCDLGNAVAHSSTTFITVATPSAAGGLFDLSQVRAALRGIGAALKLSDAPHLVVICSTVHPGATDRLLRQELEAAAGCPLGPRLGLCLLPEFVALGSVVRDLLEPRPFIIGSANASDGERLADLMRSVHRTQPTLHHLGFAGAELAKIAINNFVAMKIAFANHLGELAESLKITDPTAVAAAVGEDRRIGRSFFRPAMPFGGPCFPRDVRAFGALARMLDLPGDLQEAVHALNEHHTERLVKAVLAALPPGGRVGLLGMSFKAGTADVAGSLGVELARRLAAAKVRPLVYDPMVPRQVLLGLGLDVRFAESAADAAAADVVVITTECSEFKGLACRAEGRTLIDPWRMAEEGGASPEWTTTSTT